MSAPGNDGVSGSEGVGGSAANALPDPPYDGGGRWDEHGHDLPAREPERHAGPTPDLGPIYERMDHLAAQNQALVDAFQSAAANDEGYESRVDADGMVELTDEEMAALDALSPEEFAALDAELGDELNELDDDGEPPDIFDFIDRSVQSRLADAEQRRDAESAFEDREGAFEELRDRMPLLQHEPTARRIVGHAQELAMSWDPDLIGRPEFVHLIELVGLASIAQRATAQQNAQQLAHRDVQIESASGGSGLGSDDGPRGIDWGARVVSAAERLRPKI